jgi:AcrR family transcriptional regulator
MTPRRAYHHGDLAEALVSDGLALLEAKGLEALSLRAAARRAKVSAAAVSRHFADKESLLAAIATRGFAELNQEFARVLAAAKKRPPLDHLRVLGRAYVDFALAHPGLYRLMFGAARPKPGQHAALEDEARRAYRSLGAVIAACCPAGTKDAAIATATVAAWSMVHGYALLRLDGQLAALPPDQLPDTAALLASLIPRVA